MSCASAEGDAGRADVQALVPKQQRAMLYKGRGLQKRVPILVDGGRIFSSSAEWASKATGRSTQALDSRSTRNKMNTAVRPAVSLEASKQVLA